jgi:hypothetical protein
MGLVSVCWDCRSELMVPESKFPQFSLRMLLVVVAAICVIVGLVTNWYRETLWALWFLVSPAVATAFLACLVKLSLNYSVPSRGQLAICGVVGALCMLALIQLGPNTPSNASFVIFTIMFVLSVSLSVAELAFWLAWRLERDVALVIEARQAARVSLLVISSGLVIAAALIATSSLRQTTSIPGLDPGPAWLVVAVAGLLSAFPWVRMVRRRRVVHRRFGVAEYLSLGALVISDFIAIFAAGAAVVIANTKPSGLGAVFYHDIMYGLFCFIPIWSATGLVVVGLLIQLWRDQWHLGYTVIACTWVVLFWLIMAFYWAH